MKRYIFLLIYSALVLCAAEVQGRDVYPLNDGWRFFFKSENGSDDARYISLPHSWNTDARATAELRATTANYLHDLYIPQEWSDSRIFIRFHGAESTADLFVNGSHVGGHRGAGVAFAFEITDKVRMGADNALLVVVDNGYRDDLLPTSTDINIYGGLTRGAELIVTPRMAVSPLYLGTDGALVHQTSVSAGRVEGDVEVHVTSRGEREATLLLEIAPEGGKTCFTRRQKIRVDQKAARLPFAFDNPKLWSPSSPALYNVTVTIEESGDRVTVRTGFRTVEAVAGGLKINGVPTPVRGVVMHHDNQTVASAYTDADYVADLAFVEDMGANALRSVVMPHGDCLYRLCDERGIMAWVDLPLHRASSLGDVAYYATAAFEQHGTQLLSEIIAQHQNNPSVVMWGLFSLLQDRGDKVLPYIRRLNDLAHRMDPSRPTVALSDQDGDINFITDLIVWRQDIGWNRGSTDDVTVWRDMLQRSWSHLRSAVTYGGAGFTDHVHLATNDLSRRHWMPEANQTRFHEEYCRNLATDSLFWGRWVANLFDHGSARRPYGVCAEGVVTQDRRTKKDAYWLYRAMWNRNSPTLHIAEKRLVYRVDSVQTLRVYSSQGAPLLLVGADTVRMKEYAPCHYHADSVAMHPGKVHVKVYSGDLADSVTLRIGSGPRPAPRFVPLKTKGLQTTN